MFYGRIVKTTLTLCAIALLAGCAGKSALESNRGIEGAPDWVNKGMYTKPEAHDGKHYYGIGEAPPMGARSLQAAAADNRARAALAASLEITLKDDLRDTQHSSNVEGEAVSDSSIDRTLTSKINTLIKDARIIARWHDPQTNILYSLAELNYDRHSERTGAQ